jgi:hypothetical protein
MKDQVFINSVDDRDGLILFRHLGDNVPPGCTPRLNWQVEYYGHHNRGFPIGLAWVVAPPPGEPWPKGFHPVPWVKFVLVVDDERRRGIATKLVQAIRQRWPGAMLTDGISAAGEALVQKLDSRPEPSDCFTPEGIKQMRAEGFTDGEIQQLAEQLRSW